MWIQVGRVTGKVNVGGDVYESPNGVNITVDGNGTRVVDAVTGEPVQPQSERDGGAR
jgi:hypothetical protein